MNDEMFRNLPSRYFDDNATFADFQADLRCHPSDQRSDGEPKPNDDFKMVTD